MDFLWRPVLLEKSVSYRELLGIQYISRWETSAKENKQIIKIRRSSNVAAFCIKNYCKISTVTVSYPTYRFFVVPFVQHFHYSRELLCWKRHFSKRMLSKIAVETSRLFCNYIHLKHKLFYPANKVPISGVTVS